jgi:hypothetical protein
MGVLDDAIKEHLDLKRRRGADPAEIEKAEREALGPVRREAVGSSALSQAEPPAGSGLGALGPAPEEFDFDIEPGEITDEHPTTVAPPLPVVEPSEADAAPVGIAAPDYDHPEADAFAVSDAPEVEAIDADPPPRQPIAAMPEFDHKPKRRGLFHRRSHEDTDFGETVPLPAELPDDDPFADEPENMEAREIAAGEAVGRAQPIQRDEPGPSAPAPSRPQPPALQITPDAELGHTVEYDVEQAFAEEDGSGEDILEETPDFLADTPDHDRLWFEQKPPPDFDFDR